MSEADLKWFDLCFEYKDGPYSAIQLYKAALRREIEKYQEEHGDNQGPIDYTLAKILSLLDTVEP